MFSLVHDDGHSGAVSVGEMNEVKPVGVSSALIGEPTALLG